MSEESVTSRLEGPSGFFILLLALMVRLGMKPTIKVRLLDEHGEAGEAIPTQYSEGRLTLFHAVRFKTVAPFWMIAGTLKRTSTGCASTDSPNEQKPMVALATYNSASRSGHYVTS